MDLVVLGKFWAIFAARSLARSRDAGRCLLASTVVRRALLLLLLSLFVSSAAAASCDKLVGPARQTRPDKQTTARVFRGSLGPGVAYVRAANCSTNTHSLTHSLTRTLSLAHRCVARLAADGLLLVLLLLLTMDSIKSNSAGDGECGPAATATLTIRSCWASLLLLLRAALAAAAAASGECVCVLLLFRGAARFSLRGSRVATDSGRNSLGQSVRRCATPRSCVSECVDGDADGAGDGDAKDDANAADDARRGSSLPLAPPPTPTDRHTRLERGPLLAAVGHSRGGAAAPPLSGRSQRQRSEGGSGAARPEYPVTERSPASGPSAQGCRLRGCRSRQRSQQRRRRRRRRRWQQAQ